MSSHNAMSFLYVAQTHTNTTLPISRTETHPQCLRIANGTCKGIRDSVAACSRAALLAAKLASGSRRILLATCSKPNPIASKPFAFDRP